MNIRNNRLQRGFTLVEVIVVAVIVAILAGVSVPLYLGYINNSRDNSAANAAGSAASFAAACVNSGKSINLATGTEIVGDGTKKIICGDVADAASPALIVPKEIIIKREDNAIKGKHEKHEGETWSQPFTFTTATPVEEE